MPESRSVYGQESISLTTWADADMGCFTEKEKEVIELVCSRMKSLTAHDISDLSHAEPAWQNHLHQTETIPYAEAFSLVAM